MTHPTPPGPSVPDAGVRWVVPLAELTRGDLSVAGGKGANLGELVRAGFPVPEGVVITTAAYRAVAEEDPVIRDALPAGPGAGSDDRPGRPADASAIGSVLRERFAAVGIPPVLAEEITAAYHRLGSGPVAVRSSATAEDLPGAAFAGQQDTLLGVVGEQALLDAVRQCWGSLWNDRASAYRRRRGIDPAGAAVAVVVQRMVPADFAGVLFTANPVTGARDEVVVDAGAGLGESVVSGLVTPDHIVVGPDGGIRSRQAGRREVVLRQFPAGGVERITPDRLEDPEPPLSDAVARELADLGRAVAAHFGCPQDVEWARHDERFVLLQARPMTALPPPPIRLNRRQRFLGPVFAELVPLRPYPMDMSAWLLPGPGRMLRRMLAELPGLHLDLADVLPEVDGVVDRFVPPSPRPTPAVLGAPRRLLPRLRRFRPADWTADRRFTAFEQEVGRLTGFDPSTLDWTVLRRLPRRAAEAVDLITDLRVDHLPRAGFDLLRLRLALGALGLGELFGDLAAGPTRTSDANAALDALAATVRETPALRVAFSGSGLADLADRIATDPAAAGFREALQAFLDEYGHRETTSLLLMSGPTWREDPAAVLSTVAALASAPSAPTGPGRAELARRRLLAHPLVGRRRIGALDRLVEGARAAVALREDTHFHSTRTLPVLQRAVREIGSRFTAAGVLDDPADVLHLRRGEIERSPAPDTLSAAGSDRIRTLVAARSARRDELAGVPLIAPAVLFGDRTHDDDVLLTGTPAGGGRVTGPVRIVHSHTGFARLATGDVLVCPATNPSWTPLFGRAAAVVVDHGGAASHAAIVAREYGIPAVMGTGTGTTVLTDGQQVTVDGDAGTVADAGRAG
ncbi:PEP/pyruvate-binding domain-containing protein [Pseudonocardia sp. NPDC049635]|uniref:PEP/pyruvate-binding domain-containing protein n=1 Tax=Pseudonocardia sp. NPDC049635 TaxID=3155506 RepID=UPI0033ED312E